MDTRQVNKEQASETREEYRFERVSQEKLKDLQLLYKASFEEDVSAEFLKMKYDTSAFGVSFTGYIAYSAAGEPAAYYGVFPCKAIINGKISLAAQSGDTMTHPDHRGKGLFIKLAKATYQLAAQEGIKFVFGFPNENSYHGFVKKLGWIHSENLNIYRLKVFTLPLGYLSSRISLFKNLYSSYCSSVLKKYNPRQTDFENPHINSQYGGLLRDKDFFKYKNYYPKEVITINGKKIYIKTAGALRVGDIEHCTREEFFLIVKKLKKLARRLGCYAVIFYYSPGTQFDKYLSEITDAEKGLAIGYVNLTEGQDPGLLKFSQADLDTF